MWTNYHTHTDFCDGKKSIAEVVAAAKEMTMPVIGFSSHAPLPFECKWSMRPSQLNSYLSEIKTIKLLDKSIDIYAGLEVDFIPGKTSPSSFRHQLDYVIGSIHFVDTFEDGQRWEIDGPYSSFRTGLDKIFQNDMKAAVLRYLELTRQMITESSPDIIGHLDKIKMQNKERTLYKEDEAWYQDAMRQTLRVIREAGSIVEVNTRGMYQGKTTTAYPSPWIIEEISKMNIPVTLSSDAHHPEDLVNGFSAAAKILLQAGIKKIRILSEGKWRDVSFDEHGIANYKVAF
jgi:histidinol-phosphatase (PHP family)